MEIVADLEAFLIGGTLIKITKNNFESGALFIFWALEKLTFVIIIILLFVISIFIQSDIKVCQKCRNF